MHSLLTEAFKPLEKQITTAICTCGSIDKIYMLGSTLLQLRTTSIFDSTSPTARTVAQYYVLVLVEKEKTTANSELQDKIENGCRQIVPVTAIVLDIVQFNQWLNEGHQFACMIVERANCIYQKDNLPHVIYHQRVGNTEAEKKCYAEARSRVKEFIAGAELYRLRTQYKMAAFMLHQATEHSLLAMFKKATGLQVNTHNLDKLYRYCSMIEYRLPAIFPRKEEKDQKLFTLLQKAYIETRYKSNYSINAAELEALIEKVKAVFSLI